MHAAPRPGLARPWQGEYLYLAIYINFYIVDSDSASHAALS